MIISRTPFRVSFFGGGTDYAAWFSEHGGATLASTINKYCYITCRVLPPFFDHRSVLSWSKVERVDDVAEFEHPVVREVLRHLGIDDGVAIHHQGDLPARSGLGSSSAFTVGLLHALHAMCGRMMSKTDLAREAIFVEQDLLRENVGVQDQIETAHGGLNVIGIDRDGGFAVNPIVIPRERLRALQSHMLLVYTRVSRHASAVAADKIAAIPDKQRELTLMRAMVDEAVGILLGDRPLAEFGTLLHESWLLKRELSAKVAPAFVNEIYEAGRAAGALGGKVLGAGGGGFMLFFAPPERHPAILAALDGLVHVPFEFETGGSQIIFYDPDQHTLTAHRPR